MPKKILQDMVPRKSIRSITKNQDSDRAPQREVRRETPRTAPRERVREEEEVIEQPIERPRRPAPRPQPQRGEKKKGSMKATLLILLALIIIGAASVAGFTYFSSAKVSISPKQQIIKVDGIMLAKKDPKTTLELPYEVVSINQTATENVSTIAGAYVQEKAKGTVTLYNSFSVTAQKLVAGTRLKNSKGLIYKLDAAVTIPGYKKVNGKTVAGSADAKVTADQAGDIYNGKLADLSGDFTIVAYEGTPKASTLYGRLKTDFTGGYVGKSMEVAPEVASSTEKSLKDEVTKKLLSDYNARIPQGYISYPGTYTFVIDKPTISVDKDGKGLMSVKGTIYGAIFSKQSLLDKILSKESDRFPRDSYEPKGLESLTFTLLNKSDFSPIKETNMSFQLKGTMSMVGIIPKEEIQKKLAGLTVDQSRAVFADYKGVGSADVSFSPPWVTTIPENPQRIIIEAIDIK